jgi:hypothetical protein
MKLSTDSNTLSSDVVVNVATTKGQYFKGKVESRKLIDSKYKNDDGSKKMRDIYILSVIDTDMDTVQKKQGSKEYTEVSVAPGDKVTVFPPTRLNNALKQTKDGDIVLFTYLGLGKATGRGGKPHTFDVELI